MRFFKGTPDGSLAIVSGWVDVPVLESLGIPLSQYSGVVQDAGGTANWHLPVWAPAWALQFIEDWPVRDVLFDDGGHDVQRRVIARVLETGNVEFAQAAVAVARLHGAAAVEEMLGA